MYKMIIRINEDKVLSDQVFDLNTVYDKLDAIFAKRGFSLRIENGNRVYFGTDASTDYPNLGIILNGLKKQDWFVKNLLVLVLCTNEDSEDLNDFEEEDLVEYFGLAA